MNAIKALFVEFYKQVIHAAPSLASGFLIFIGFWLGALILKKTAIHLGRRSRIEPSLIRLLSRSVYLIVIIFGAVTALGTTGVNIGALIAGLGLSGFALGFAFKDALSNLLSGISILLYKPFRVGDHINISGLEGNVVDIDLRYTILDSSDKKILVPNSNMFTNSVIILKDGGKQQQKFAA